MAVMVIFHLGTRLNRGKNPTINHTEDNGHSFSFSMGHMYILPETEAWNGDVKGNEYVLQVNSKFVLKETRGGSVRHQWPEPNQQETGIIRLCTPTLIYIFHSTTHHYQCALSLHRPNHWKHQGPRNYRMRAPSIPHCLRTAALLAEMQTVN